MKLMAIGAGLALMVLASTTSPAFAGSDDVYFWCWKQADYVRPVLDPKGGKEPLGTRKKKRQSNY